MGRASRTGIEGLARGQGARVTHDHSLPRPFRALLLDDEIVVRPCRDPAQVCAAIAHELAHHAAKRAGLCLAHPDVWRLTLAILVPQSMTVLWVASAAVGFFMAPIWATGYNFAGQSIKLTATISSLIILGDSFGAVVLPWLTGLAIERFGAHTMPWLVFISLMLNALVFGVMLLQRSRMTKEIATA